MKILALSLAALLPCLAAGPDVDKGRTMGNPAAPMLFELYSDFMCPACKTFTRTYCPPSSWTT
jgi:protein-disulfide isomerase